MSEPEEYFTYDQEIDSVIRHETLDGAESLAEELSYVEDVFVQFAEPEDLDDGGFNTFRNE